jgi:5-methylcytosine-specific restriction endonuclease McrA
LHHRGEYPPDWPAIAARVKVDAGWCCIRCKHPNDRDTGHVLTVHHLDGDKANVRWWNLLALCQKCHLQIQAKLNPDQAYLWEHTAWFKPYVACYYAFKHAGLELTREEAERALEHWLLLGQPHRMVPT